MITKINIKLKLKKIIRYKIKKKSNQNKTIFFLKDIQIRSIIKSYELLFNWECCYCNHISNLFIYFNEI
jgi:hypothetical protein